jgi:hypothetical protein
VAKFLGVHGGTRRLRTFVLSACLALAFVLWGATGVSAAEPTCSTTLGLVVHGQHIVGDYLTGIGHEGLTWPPGGGVVGDAIARSGVVIAGGPRPGFHFPNGFAPGASFCLLQSQAPGIHPGP